MVMTIKAQTGLSKRRDGEGKPIGPLVTGREYQQERCVTGEECLPTGAAPCAPGGGKDASTCLFHTSRSLEFRALSFFLLLGWTRQFNSAGGKRQG